LTLAATWLRAAEAESAEPGADARPEGGDAADGGR